MVESLATNRLGKSGIEISAIRTGLWAVGGGWGPVDDQNALRWKLIAKVNRLTSALLPLDSFFGSNWKSLGSHRPQHGDLLEKFDNLVPTGNHLGRHFVLPTNSRVLSA
jgi:hypothetical protein